MGIKSRLYENSADLEKMRGFLVKAWAETGPGGGYFHVGDLLWRMFSFDSFRPEQDIRLWLDTDDNLIGFAWFYARLNAVDWQVFPPPLAHRLGKEMISWAESRPYVDTGGPRKLTTGCLEKDGERAALLEELGYAKADHFYIHYLRPLDAPVPNPQLPPGFTMRHVKETEADVAARVALHRAAFHPSQTTIESYGRVRGAPGYIPELDLVAVAPDGAFAAFCLCWLDPVNRVGEFEPVGTHPDYRRRGLARAVQTVGLQRMQARGAKTAVIITGGANSAARNLYQSQGFTEIYRDFDYVKVFQGAK